MKQKKKVARVNIHHGAKNPVETSCITSKRIKFSNSVNPNKKRPTFANPKTQYYGT